MEQGSHDQLVDAGGYYERLYRLGFSVDEADLDEGLVPQSST